MSSESKGTKGQPYFSSSGAPDIAVDPSLVADYAALVGNRIVGTAAQRTAGVVPGTAVPFWDCLKFYETDTGLEWLYNAATTAWVLVGGYLAPAFSVIASGAQGLASGTQALSGAWGTAPVVNRGFTSWSGGLLTVALAGLYWVSGQVTTSQTINQSQVWVSGVQKLTSNAGSGGTSGTPGTPASGLLPLSTGDTVQMRSFSNSSGTVTTANGATRLDLFFIAHA